MDSERLSGPARRSSHDRTFLTSEANFVGHARPALPAAVPGAAHLLEASGSGFPFEQAWTIAAEAALAYMPARDARSWWDVLTRMWLVIAAGLSIALVTGPQRRVTE